MKHVGVKAFLGAAVLALSVAAAGASTTASCTVVNGTDTFAVTLDVSSACFAVGTGNINGTKNKDPLLTGSDTTAGTVTEPYSVPVGFKYLGVLSFTDIAEPGKTGNEHGTISLGLLGVGYSDLVVGIKFGDQWAAFNVSASDSPYAFTILPKQRAGISHVNLYGVVSAVPLPTTGLLLIGGIGGLAALRRRRKAA